jgi:dipeptidyl aminopeptidase/acylaminoacyl peptidase
VITPSPDGAYFFFLTNAGELESDSTRVELKVYAVDQVRSWLAQSGRRAESLPPYRSVVRRSGSSDPNKAAILGARWQTDGSGIVFLAMTEQRELQAQRLDLRSGTVTHLTEHPGGITNFWMQGESLLYQSDAPLSYAPGYPMTVFDRQSDGTLVPPKQAGTMHTYAISRRGESPRELVGDSDGIRYDERWMSPNGRFAVGLYEGANPDFPGHRARTLGTAQQFVLIDLETARAKPLGLEPRLYVPNTRLQVFADVFWSADSARFILVNVVPRDGEGHHATRPAIGAFDVGTGEWRPLLDMYGPLAAGAPSKVPPSTYVTRVEWLTANRELVVTEHVEDQADRATVYAFGTSGITHRASEAAVKMLPRLQSVAAGRKVSLDGLSISLHEGINEPPRIVASDGRHQANLTAPDAALQGVRFARTEPFQWRDADGQTVTGGLTLPPGFTRGHPVPLVIQGYFYWPDAFLPDGHTKTPSAARQALVARGMAVLEMDNPKIERIDYRDRYVRRIDSAVDALARAGFVDPSKVGVTGFSHAGYLTYYAITHPGDVRLGAVVCADSWGGDFHEYLFAGAFGGAWGASLSSFEFVNSGEETLRPLFRKPDMTFWDRKSQWLEHDTTFNVDRVQTPVLFTLHGGTHPPGGYLAGIERIGAFMLANKPVDYVYFPDGSHQLERPRERLAMMNLTVDWMAFWLQDYEDPDPAKATQYARWATLRAQENRILAEESHR